VKAEVRKRIAAARAVLFDLDGTLALGDREAHGYRSLAGAVELLEGLRRAGRPYAILTNGTMHTPHAYVEMLRGSGFDVAESAMLTPAVVAADFFVRKGYRNVLVLGEEGSSRPLIDAGLVVTRPGEAAARAGEAAARVDAVFVGWHPDFGLRDLEAACNAAWAGASLYTASVAPFFATRSGKAIGVSGAICAAIASVTRQRVHVLGKPALVALRVAARRLEVACKELLVVGDDPELETRMARAGGAAAIGVLSGFATADAYARLPPARRAHLVVNSVADLLPLFA